MKLKTNIILNHIYRHFLAGILHQKIVFWLNEKKKKKRVATTLDIFYSIGAGGKNFLTTSRAAAEATRATAFTSSPNPVRPR